MFELVTGSLLSPECPVERCVLLAATVRVSPLLTVLPLRCSGHLHLLPKRSIQSVSHGRLLLGPSHGRYPDKVPCPPCCLAAQGPRLHVVPRDRPSRASQCRAASH
jgi:hypothetical protein